MCFQDERGFTLVESLLHCLLFAVASLGIALLILISYHVPTTAQVFEETEFEVVCFDLNNLLLDDVQKISYKSNKRLIVYVSEVGGEYDLSISPPYLYRSKSNGLQPLLASATDFSGWFVEDQAILLKLHTLDDYKKERRFYVPTIIK